MSCSIVDVVESGEFDLELVLELSLELLSGEELELCELDVLMMGNKVCPIGPRLVDCAGLLDLMTSL